MLRYRKQRKHTKGQTKKITRRLLDLLGKILRETRKMEREHEGVELFTDRERRTINIITKVYRQQHNHFRSGDARESIPDRIVSIAQPYVRPIVRGKEVKSVEFGAKCNNILVDGISFIEKLSFNAFNEGTRLTHCIKMHKRLFGRMRKRLAGTRVMLVTPTVRCAQVTASRHPLSRKASARRRNGRKTL